ncbi:uncharacterized protein LOC142564721 isoform X2 [Dermacentor variabilis]|uniref:uncharacterized protein LOC142564721 isoform X2 n=1 Tax=Dermacentor variabilis TaxID=34621 RepID=UPI003F5C5B71
MLEHKAGRKSKDSSGEVQLHAGRRGQLPSKTMPIPMEKKQFADGGTTNRKGQKR